MRVPKSHCKYGHELTPENKDRYHRCIICSTDQQKLAQHVGKRKRCTQCGGRNYSTTGRDLCSKCLRITPSAKLKNEDSALRKWDESYDNVEIIFTKRAKHMDEREVMAQFGQWIKAACIDFTDFSPVICYQPGTPEFNQIAGLYA